jgi:putative heme-binding domain-containing protein
LILQIVATNKDPAVQAAMLNGMLAGFAGQRQVQPPAVWASLYPQLQKSSSAEVQRAANKLAQIFGDRGAHEKAVATALDKKAALEQRREALAALVNQKRPELKKLVSQLLDDSTLPPSLWSDAVRAYSVYDDPNGAKQLLRGYKNLDSKQKRTLLETLATRRSYAELLLAAIQSAGIPKKDVPVYLARSLQQMLGASFTEVWGEVKVASADKAKLMARYKSLLTESHLAKGNISKGREVFTRTCFACHKLFGTGGQVGPEITGSNRANLDYILYQIIDPNAEVPEAYRMVMVSTDGGEVISGRIVAEDDQRLTLQTTRERKTILKSEIDERQLSPNSMMPENMLTLLKDDEVRDLILYLRSNKQVSLPK